VADLEAGLVHHHLVALLPVLLWKHWCEPGEIAVAHAWLDQVDHPGQVFVGGLVGVFLGWGGGVAAEEGA
jgi:hypothetical protein